MSGHLPVLLDETIAALAPAPGRLVVDCTLGRGGHAEALLERGCSVIGIDRDPQAIAESCARLASFGDRFRAVHGRFSDVRSALDRLGVATVDGLLADLGVSSPQLDEVHRGFSFRGGPLDMRMDPGQPLTAADVVNTWTEEALADAIFTWGEERRSRAVARAIVAGRPWSDNAALAATIARVVGRGDGHINPATRTFQALRIAVNGELDELEALLPVSLERLAPGGALVVLSYHSLEDRLVKQFLAKESGRGVERDAFGYPVLPPRLRAAGRPLRASPSDPNPRARSVRLRSAVRLP